MITEVKIEVVSNGFVVGLRHSDGIEQRWLTDDRKELLEILSKCLVLREDSIDEFITPSTTISCS